MQIKTVSYQRVINCGNYESKRLEMFAEIVEGEDEEEAISLLMQAVERKVREDAQGAIESEISKLQKQLRELQNEYETVKSSLESKQEADLDDVLVEGKGSTSSDEPVDF